MFYKESKSLFLERCEKEEELRSALESKYGPINKERCFIEYNFTEYNSNKFNYIKAHLQKNFLSIYLPFTFTNLKIKLYKSYFIRG